MCLTILEYFILKGERKFSQESSIVDGEHSSVSVFNFDK